MPRAVLPDLTTVPGGPNVDGFAEAQERLRIALGEDVAFHVPITPVWPPGIEIDPQTQAPYDPTVDPISGGGESDVLLHVLPVQRPIQRGDDVIEGPYGVRQDETIAFRMVEADHVLAQDAVAATWRGIRYRITEIVDDGDQWIAFGEAT